MQELTDTIERRSLSDQIFGHIKKLILSGELAAGERVPEARIGELFGVSRTPMREALRRLEQYGLIRIKPRSYAEVVTMEAEEIDQIAEVRSHVEALSARLLARRATEQDCSVLARLAGECEELLQSGDMAAAFERDSEFHLEVAERCGNPYVFEIMQRLDSRIQLSRLVRCGTQDHVARALKVHHALVDAFRHHAVEEAVSIMGEHVQSMTPESWEDTHG